MKIQKAVLDGLSKFLGLNGLDLEESFKRTLSFACTVMIVPLLIFMGSEDLYQGNLLLGLTLNALGVFFGLNIVFIKSFKKTTILAIIDMILIGLLFLYLLAVSGPHGFMGIWIFAYPLTVFFMLGLPRGLYLIIAFLAAVISLILFQDLSAYLVPLNREFKVRFFLTFFLVSFISFFYELIRQKYKKGVEEWKLKVEEEKKVGRSQKNR